MYYIVCFLALSKLLYNSGWQLAPLGGVLKVLLLFSEVIAPIIVGLVVGIGIALFNHWLNGKR